MFSVENLKTEKKIKTICDLFNKKHVLGKYVKYLSQKNLEEFISAELEKKCFVYKSLAISKTYTDC